jgi:hypothetical protein
MKAVDKSVIVDCENKFRANKTSFPPCTAVETGAWGLDAEHLIHVVTPIYNTRDDAGSGCQYRLMIRNCLDKSAQLN